MREMLSLSRYVIVYKRQKRTSGYQNYCARVRCAGSEVSIKSGRRQWPPIFGGNTSSVILCCSCRKKLSKPNHISLETDPSNPFASPSGSYGHPPAFWLTCTYLFHCVSFSITKNDVLMSWKRKYSVFNAACSSTYSSREILTIKRSERGLSFKAGYKSAISTAFCIDGVKNAGLLLICNDNPVFLPLNMTYNHISNIKWCPLLFLTWFKTNFPSSGTPSSSTLLHWPDYEPY